MVKPEKIAAAGPRDPRERHGAPLTLQLQGCQEASLVAAGPWVFSILSWDCKTSLANSSPQERDDPSPLELPAVTGPSLGSTAAEGCPARTPTAALGHRGKLSTVPCREVAPVPPHLPHPP